MALATGFRLGAYEIVSLLGAGGMGEVYRAQDTKLGRAVAIKVLPQALASAPDRIARFEREAKALASFNHPHIATLYGTEESCGQSFLVMELVEGETLADRLEHAPIPVKEALTIARQIADALDASHEKGIVHRDLKPANIKITSDGIVKVLDFGLAKAASTTTGPDASQSPTITVAGTREGVILGTAAYMSPEQARGQTVDKRTDIWAFGCVLFEMVSGRQPFAGATLSDTIAAILQREPAWETLPRSIPAKIHHLLRRCLQKDPSRRLRDIGDARVEIEEALADRDYRPRAATAWKIASVVALAAGVSVAIWLRPERPAQSDRATWIQLTRFPDSVTQPALSPDGRMLTFVRGQGTFHTPGQIYVKMLPDGEP